MSNALRTVEFLCLGIWLGGICLLSFVVAPGAFRLLSPDQAGAVVRFTLSRMHFLGLSLGVLYLAVHTLRPSSPGSLARTALILVTLMILLTAASQFYVSGHLDQLRQQMGSVASTPADSPLRVQFDTLHRASVWLEGAVLLLGFAASYATVRS